MKVFRISSLLLLLCTLAGSACLNGIEARDPDRPTKEERKAGRERKVAERATAATQVKVREGKHPSYNRLLKSTDYPHMYTEALRYYNMKKKGKDYNTRANYTKAQNLFEEVLRSQIYAGTPKDDSLYYYYGCSFYMSDTSQDFEVSGQIFDDFRRKFQSSPFIEDAEYKYAMGFYFLSPSPEHDQSATLRAMSAIAEYEGRYPNTTHKEVIDRRMAELKAKLYVKSYENAKLYYTIGQYKAAVRAINNAIYEFPDSPYREELLYLATRSAYMLARNSVPNLMTDRYLGMMDNYLNFISEYPETEYLREVEQMRDEAGKHIELNTKTGATTDSTVPVTSSANGN